MHFLADENFLGVAVETLRKQGHDVVWIRTHAPGSSDVDVLAMAEEENRILLTFDRDFGELAFQAGLPAICGTGRSG
jgi:predicted nuclease of predicted toxin-antitoxin system